ncbi:MAG: hypothetical protein PHP57_08325 [Sideroxydans sp.]|nr:hypothetical protein [Sideroxydans sp.]
MESGAASITEFNRRKRTFMIRGIVPVVGMVLLGCGVMAMGLPDNKPIVLAANLLIFFAGVWFVISAKRHYRCPVCEKVVVPTKDDGTPSEISFGIAYKPKVCPYCSAQLS